jgi:glycosyltransferase involved in cell wall biosynthesis
LYYESGSGFGGSARSLVRLVKGLDRSRFQPIIFTCGVGPAIEDANSHGLPVILTSPSSLERAFSVWPKFRSSVLRNVYFYLLVSSSFLRFFSAFRRIVKEYRIDLIHANNGIYENLPAILIARLLHIPCICHVRGTEPITRLEKRVFPWVQRFITTNAHTEALYKSNGGAEKTLLVYNGIDLRDFSLDATKSHLRTEYSVDNFAPTVGSIGRIVEGKGFDEFINAARLVINERAEVKFFIIGNNPLGSQSVQARLMHLVHQLSLDKNVIFTGWRDDIINVISELDLICQASTYPEGLGMALIEAMALKKPVVATRIPGHTEIVDNRSNGLLVEPGDCESLAESILLLLNDRKLAEAMGETGRKKVETVFSSEKNVEKVQRCYTEILSSTAQCSPAGEIAE